MQVIIGRKGADGIPAFGSEVKDLTGITSDVTYTHAAFWGPLSARVVWQGSLREGWEAADQWLGNPITIYDPSGAWQWEGLIWAVNFNAGGRSGSRSLEGYANRVRLHYNTIDTSTSPPTDLGPGTPIVADDTAGQDTYNIIEENVRAGRMTTAVATRRASRRKNERRFLLWTPGGGTLGGSLTGPQTITLECYGWWRTTMYQAYTNATSGAVEVATIVEDILGTACPFISTNYDLIGTTGETERRYFDRYEPAGEIIKRVVETVDTWVFRIDQGRIPVLEASQRETTTPAYNERADGVLEDAAGAVVPLWSVRPDAVLRRLDWVPPSASLSAAIESIESVYLAETTYNARNNTLIYKPAVIGGRGEVRPL